MVTVNFSLNQTYFVDKTSFEKIVKKAGAKAKFLKVKEFDVIISEDKNDFRVELKAEIKKGTPYKKAIESFTTELDAFSLNLIDSKPKNVTIIVEGEY